MRYLLPEEVRELHRLVIAQSGGLPGVRDVASLESALAQPHQTFAGEELYQSLIDKAAALGFSLVRNHPFVDGNKRVGHAAMETFLVLNGHEIAASTAEQEETILRLAAGEISREEFTAWLRARTIERRNT